MRVYASVVALRSLFEDWGTGQTATALLVKVEDRIYPQKISDPIKYLSGTYQVLIIVPIRYLSGIYLVPIRYLSRNHNEFYKTTFDIIVCN